MTVEASVVDLAGICRSKSPEFARAKEREPTLRNEIRKVKRMGTINRDLLVRWLLMAVILICAPALGKPRVAFTYIRSAPTSRWDAGDSLSGSEISAEPTVRFHNGGRGRRQPVAITARIPAPMGSSPLSVLQSPISSSMLPDSTRTSALYPLTA